MWPKEVLDAYKIAKDSFANAHAPYSKFKVGAAVKARGESRLFGGCNVENSSYGATVCAERTAILKAVSELGAIEVEFVLLVTNVKGETPPCALCLQVLSEFATSETKIYLANLKDIVREVEFKQLLPTPFDKEQLPEI